MSNLLKQLNYQDLPLGQNLTFNKGAIQFAILKNLLDKINRKSKNHEKLLLNENLQPLTHWLTRHE